MWSSPQSSELVWTGCRRILSSRRSLAGSTCESLWSVSGWKRQQINKVSVVIQGSLNYDNTHCWFVFEEVEISHVVMQLISQSNPPQGRCVSGCQMTNSFTHLGNMWPVSFTSLHGMWCFTSGLFIQVWMLTISFLSSSDMEELSISSEGH